MGWWRNLYKIRLGEQAMGYLRRKIEEGKNPRVTDRRGRSTLNMFDIGRGQCSQHKVNKSGKTGVSSEAHWSWRNLEVMASALGLAPTER